MRLVAITACQPLAEMLSSGAGNWPPALLTRPWMRPRAARMAATVAFTASSSRMSQAARLASPPSLADLGRDRVELAALAADQHHVRAERGELVGGAAADAAAAAGDDDGLAGEQAGSEHAAVAHGCASRRSSACLNKDPRRLAWRRMDELRLNPVYYTARPSRPARDRAPLRREGDHAARRRLGRGRRLPARTVRARGRGRPARARLPGGVRRRPRRGLLPSAGGQPRARAGGLGRRRGLADVAHHRLAAGRGTRQRGTQAPRAAGGARRPSASRRSRSPSPRAARTSPRCAPPPSATATTTW